MSQKRHSRAVREFRKELAQRLGVRVERIDQKGSGHVVMILKHDRKRWVHRMASTPSDTRWLQNNLARVKRRMRRP